jgi:hypothetical protein
MHYLQRKRKFHLTANLLHGANTASIIQACVHLEAPFSAVGKLGRERLTRFIRNAASRICLKF